MNAPIVRARNLEVHYPLFKGFLQRLLGGGRRYVRAVDGVAFEVRPGEVFGLVGESGCGKSTTGRALLGLAPVTGGEIALEFPRQGEERRVRIRPRALLLACAFWWGCSALGWANALAFALWGSLPLPLLGFEAAAAAAAWTALAAVEGGLAAALWLQVPWSRRPARVAAAAAAVAALLAAPWGLVLSVGHVLVLAYLGTPGIAGLIRQSGWLGSPSRLTLRPAGILEGDPEDRGVTWFDRWFVGPRAVPAQGFSWTLRTLRSKVQIVYQDPHAALNPALTVGESVEHALAAHWDHVRPDAPGRRATPEELATTTLQLLESVGLRPPEQFYAKLPTEISGGQKQRVVIARAIAPRPRLLVADEPVALLDMSIRAKILELMLDLKERLGLTYVFITHDLATAKLMCDRIAIMYLGRIVEMGESARIYADPKHPYTRALLQAIPIPDPAQRRPKTLPKGEVPDAVSPPAGCRFHPRCPVALATCGWEGRDFLAYLEERRLDPEQADADEAALGVLDDWQAQGLEVRGPADGDGILERVRAVLQEAPAPMAEAVADVSVRQGEVVVRFRPTEPLRPKEVDGRLVECLLY